MPLFTLIGGPNGVGKSTHARFLTERFPKIVSIDGDKVLKSLKEQGRPFTVAEGIIQDLFMNAIKNGKDIFLESNLNTPISYGYRNYAKEKGYDANLNYFAVDNLQLLNDRIQERVELYGLHYIDPATVKLKYEAALNILPGEIHKFDQVSLYDNTDRVSNPLSFYVNGKLQWKTEQNLPVWAEGVYTAYQKLEVYRSKIEDKTKGSR